MMHIRKLLLSAAMGSALLFSAQAAEPQDILQSALPAVLQEWKNTGAISTTSFSGENYTMELSALFPQKQLYAVSLSGSDSSGSSFLKCGVLNPQTGRMIIPLEYDSITALSDAEMLLCQWDSVSPRYWSADETGTLTPIELPAGYTELSPDSSGLFILSKRVQKPMRDFSMPETAAAYVAQYAIADRDMNIIRDDIDGGASGDSIAPPEYTNGAFIVQTGSTQWETGKAYSACNGAFGLIDKAGNWIGRHDYQSLSWSDQHFVASRNGKYYLLDGKGGETAVAVPMEMQRYSSWAEKEIEAAQTHEIALRFDYPQLDITRARFTELTMRLYHAVYPDKEAPLSEAQFSDCGDTDSLSDIKNAAALGIVVGYDDGTFRPYKTISRQEAAVMLDRLYTALGGAVSAASGKTYADDTQIGAWARGSVYDMRETGIMIGKTNNKFCPEDGYTAEQAIVTMERMYQALQ